MARVHYAKSGNSKRLGIEKLIHISLLSEVTLITAYVYSIEGITYLQITELKRGRGIADDLRSFPQSSAGFLLAFGRNHLRI